MNYTCHQIREDWELFVLGSLEPAQQEAMAAHLKAGCEECSRLAEETQNAVLAMATLAPPLKPVAEVERKLAQRIKMDLALESPPPRVWWGAISWAAAAACLALASWFGVRAWSLHRELTQAEQSVRSLRALQASMPTQTPPKTDQPQAALGNNRPPSQALSSVQERQLQLEARLRDETQQLHDAIAARDQAARDLSQARSELAAARDKSDSLEKQISAANAHSAGDAAQDSQQIVELRAELANLKLEVRRLAAAAGMAEQIAGLLRSGGLQQVDLKSVDPGAGQGYARAIYSPRGGLLLVANLLPQLPQRKCYQLWILRKGNPAILSAGLVQLQGPGKGFLYVPPSESLNQLTALAITDEPEGGSVSAQGHKLLFGALETR
jgi:hypothetical protein